MLRMKKVFLAFLSATLLLTTVVLGGCSTPKNALTVDGDEYTTGEYLAYLYNAFNEVYSGNQLYYYQQYGQDIWAMDFPYGEGEDAPKLKLKEYLIKKAQDDIKYQKALELQLKKYNLSISDKDNEEIEKSLKEISNSEVTKLGFNKDSYAKMFRAVRGNERALFYGLYDKGGKRAMSEEAILKYYNDNYFSYKIIEVPLVDDNNKDLSAKEIENVKKDLQKYLDMYNKDKDFDAVIEKYNKDHEEKESTTTTTGGATTTTGAATTTTVATTTTTTTAATTTTTTTSASNSDSSGSDDKDEEENKDPNRKDIDANLIEDELFVKALKEVKINTAAIKQYKKGGETQTMSLILRLDPNVREDTKTYFEDSRESIIYGAHYKEFQKEMKAEADKLSYKANDRAIKMCDPKKFTAA